MPSLGVETPSGSSIVNFNLISPKWIVLKTVQAFAIAIILYALYTVIYNLYFHPLRHVPGPLFARASGIPYGIHLRTGTIVPWVQDSHAKYGDVVRLAPSEVSFISAESAWPDIYGFRTGQYKNTGPFLKETSWFPKPVNGVSSIGIADEEDHSRMRKNVSHAFSDKALRLQEATLQSYVDLLVQRLGEYSQQDESLDIMRWFNYTTLDVIADLTFGEPFYCLRDNQYHTCVDMVFKHVESTGFRSTREKYALFAVYDAIKNLFVDTGVLERGKADLFRLASAKVSERLREAGEGKPDFFSHILKNQASEAKALSRAEMDSNAVSFLVAGSETTATTLSGATYLLLSNPHALAKLVHEVRSTFSSYDEITIDEVNKLQYMIACFSESLRLYPPVPTGFPRVVPKGGSLISGHYIAEGSSVYVSQHATNHSPRNFTDPEAYVPERWLGDARYVNDKRETVNPFSFGPRNCLGKNLAYAEMRLILAKIIYTFDLELVDKRNDWMKSQKVFVLWKKPRLMVKLTPVQREKGQ